MRASALRGAFRLALLGLVAAGAGARAAPIEPVRVRLLALDLFSEPARYELRVECGGRALQRVDAGLILPPGVSSSQVDFGGCTQIQTGLWGCAGAKRIGSTVDGSQSVAIGPGFNGGTGPRRSDTLYTSLRGNPLLCTAGGNVRLAEIAVANLPGNPAPLLVATSQLVDDALGEPHALDGNGQAVPIADVLYETGPATAPDRVIVRRLPGGAQGSPTHRFEVVFDGTEPLSRVTIGLIVPQGVTPAQVRFGGCTIPTSGNLSQRLCPSSSPDLGPNVDPAGSFTLGPASGFASQGARTDTLYAVLSGARDIGSAGNVLDPSGRPVRLGIIEIDPSVAGALEDRLPSATTLGVPGPFLPPWLDKDMELYPVSGSFGAHPREPSDLDGDENPDDVDLCPRYRESDPSADTDRDERGDECECSDQSGDGQHSVGDIVEIARAIFAPALVTPLCDTNNDDLCNVADIVGANLELFSAGHSSTCARSPVADPR